MIFVVWESNFQPTITNHPNSTGGNKKIFGLNNIYCNKNKLICTILKM